MINQEVLRIKEEYEAKNKALESQYNDDIKNEDLQMKQRMQESIIEYKMGNITKEDISKQILEIEKTSDNIKEKMLAEKIGNANKLELQQKNEILEAVKGYENNQDINVDWNYLNSPSDIVYVVNEEKLSIPVKVSLSDDDIKKISLDNVSVVNSFGQKFDEIKTGHVLQIAADVANPNDYKQDFVYMVEITDNKNNLAQPVKWVTGTLNPIQTFNTSLSWIPKEIGKYNATLSIGTDMDSVLQMADIEIIVNPEGDVSDDNYCKNGHKLLFKYSDNLPICVASDTASKLINKGLAFA